MCGADVMPNVALVSTMWSCAGRNFISREAELRGTFWKDMIANGATYRRFEDSAESAWDIISPLLALGAVELSFQQEINNGRLVPETQAGHLTWQARQDAITRNARIIMSPLTGILGWRF